MSFLCLDPGLDHWCIIGETSYCDVPKPGTVFLLEIENHQLSLFPLSKKLKTFLLTLQGVLSAVVLAIIPIIRPFEWQSLFLPVSFAIFVPSPHHLCLQ